MQYSRFRTTVLKHPLLPVASDAIMGRISKNELCGPHSESAPQCGFVGTKLRTKPLIAKTPLGGAFYQSASLRPLLVMASLVRTSESCEDHASSI